MKMSDISQLYDPKQLAVELIQMKPKKARKGLKSILSEITDPAEMAALLQALHDETKDFLADCDVEIAGLRLQIKVLKGASKIYRPLSRKGK